MHSLKTPSCVLLCAIATVSCTSSPPPDSGLSTPQPAVSTVPCSARIPYPTNDPNQCPVVLKQMYDLYGECAGLKYEQYEYQMQGEK